MLEQGPTEQRILRDVARFGMPTPKKIKNAPALHAGLELFLTGYLDLDSDRQTGWSVGRIPRMAVTDYCHSLDLNVDQTEDMQYHVREMDVVYLKYMKKKNKGS